MDKANTTYAFSLMNKPWAEIVEVIAWCVEHFGPPIDPLDIPQQIGLPGKGARWADFWGTCVVFSNHRDAAEYKLRWE